MAPLVGSYPSRAAHLSVDYFTSSDYFHWLGLLYDCIYCVAGGGFCRFLLS